MVEAAIREELPPCPDLANGSQLIKFVLYAAFFGKLPPVIKSRSRSFVRTGVVRKNTVTLSWWSEQSGPAKTAISRWKFYPAISKQNGFVRRSVQALFTIKVPEIPHGKAVMLGANIGSVKPKNEMATSANSRGAESTRARTTPTTRHPAALAVQTTSATSSRSATSTTVKWNANSWPASSQSIRELSGISPPSSTHGRKAA